MDTTKIQKAVEDHLIWCMEWRGLAEGELDSKKDDEWITMPDGFEPFAPFCGCDTCIVREVIMAYEHEKTKAEEVTFLEAVAAEREAGPIQPREVPVDSKVKYRIAVNRGIGNTSVVIETIPVYGERAVEHAKALLEAIPESTFAGDGVTITTIPSHGPGMDGA